MRPLRLPIVACLVILVAACGQSEPCVECPDVSGTYDLDVQPRSADSSTCGQIPFPGDTLSATIVQQDSRLHLAELGVDGTLMDDDSVWFEPYSVQIYGQSGTLTLSASFLAGEADGLTMQGYLTARRDSDGCSVTAPFRGDRRAGSGGS